MYELSKHRFLELKHHCAQYPEWSAEYKDLVYMKGEDPTGVLATRKALLWTRIWTILETLKEAYGKNAVYGFRPITQGEKPAKFIEQYRKFFWLLDKKL